MKQFREHAVSPVVGVMLMLVVTIIIAAVVSGFAGGLVKTQTKTPQATISATYSLMTGLTITHAGGDTLSTSNLLITTRDGPTFGTGLESRTINAVNLTTITNAAGTPVAFWSPNTQNIDGYNVTAFTAGDTWYINTTYCDPRLLQPTITGSAAGEYSLSNGEWTTNNPTDPAWALLIANPSNIGKQFYITVADKSTGAIIAQTPVTISA
jgi:FlaG/FlaF family flagellin (archaellin)